MEIISKKEIEKREDCLEFSNSDSGSEEFLLRDFDFMDVCSCHECYTKLSPIKDFEKELYSKLNLVQDCVGQFYYSHERCHRLQEIIEWTILLYESFHDKLKKTRLSSTSEGYDCHWYTRMKDMHMSMKKMLFVDEQIVHNPCLNVGHEPCCFGCRQHEIYTFHIRYLLHLYERCRVKDEAPMVLNKILDIENQRGHDKKSAKELDPSISKKNKEKQIELLKELPFEEVERGMKEILDKISPYKENRDRLDVVRESIQHMIETTSEFWEKYLKINCNVKGHDLSGLETTLDSLTNQMNLFNDQWKKDYIPSILHIITVCQQAEAQGFCPQGLCPPICPYD